MPEYQALGSKSGSVWAVVCSSVSPAHLSIPCSQSMGPTDHSFRSLSRLLLTRFRFHRARFVVSLTAIAILLFYLSTQHSPVPLSYSPSPSSLAIFSRGELPRATIGQNITFPTYLNYHFPLPSRLSSISGRARAAQRIWLTVSDEQWIDVTAGMQVFIDKLNVERDVINQVGLSETVLVVLCVDEGCMRRCREKAMYCYGGFEYTRPKKVNRNCRKGQPLFAKLTSLSPDFALSVAKTCRYEFTVTARRFLG